MGTKPLITRVKVEIKGSSFLLLFWFPWRQHLLSILSHNVLSLLASHFLQSTYINKIGFGVASLHLLSPLLSAGSIGSWESSLPLQRRWQVSQASLNSSLFTDRGRVHYRRPNSTNNVLYEKHLLRHTHTHTGGCIEHMRAHCLARSLIATGFHCYRHIKNTQA